jgi:hypothetical protein
MPNAASLPPRHALPRDITVPMLPGLGLTWYDQGAKYWRKRIGMSLMWLLVLGLIVLIDVGLFGSIRHSSHAGFATLLVIDVVLTVATLAYFAVRTVRRWNVPALPARQRGLPGAKQDRGALLNAVIQFGYVLAVIVAAIVFLICPALFLAMFLGSLLPEPLVERQARLWVADQLRQRGATA